MSGYTLLASPTLYPGQTVRAALVADGANQAPVTCRLYIRTYGADDALFRVYGPETVLAPATRRRDGFSGRIRGGGAPVFVGTRSGSLRVE